MVYATRTSPQEGIYHSELDADGKRPVSMYLPQAYEPRYPYPLLVFLHGHGETETQWIDSVPSISRRNYICLSLRGPHPVDRPDGREGYGWGRNRRCDGLIEDYVLTAVEETMRVCNVHSERIFLAGFCEGATAAYRLVLTFPEKFAGVVALNGWLPQEPLPLGRFLNGASASAFIGHGCENAAVAPRKAEEAHDILYSAGLPVRLRYYPVGHRLHPEMLRDVDRWVIDHCDGPAA